MKAAGSTRLRLGLVAAVLAGCGAAPPPEPPPTRAPQPPWAAEFHDRCRKKDFAPAGKPEDYAAPELAGFKIAAPRSCEGDDAYIRVERLAGSRRLGTARVGDGSFVEGCMTKPTSPADCPVLNFGVPGKEVHAELQRRGFPVGGPGLGPCGDVNGDYAAWNMSITVLSWHEAELAVRLVAEALDRHDVAGTLGVAVRGPACVTLL